MTGKRPEPVIASDPGLMTTDERGATPPFTHQHEQVETHEEQRAEANNRKARTAQQTFSAAAVVTVLVWLLRLADIDLNPLADQEEIPGEVVGALTALLTFVAAAWMNRDRS